MGKTKSCILVLGMALTGCVESGQNGMETTPSAVSGAPSGPLFSPFQEPLLMAGAKEATIETGDLDLDGDLDIVVTDDFFPGIRIWQNIDNTDYIQMPVVGLDDPLNPTLGWDTTTFALGDLDGDGDLDLVQGRTTESRVWFNQGNLLFQDSGQSLKVHPYLGTFPTKAIEIADMDGDGDLDIVNGAMCQVWFNDGTGLFKSGSQFIGLDVATAIEAGDLDGDGDVDLVVVNPGKGIFVYRNDGTGTFDYATRQALAVPEPDAMELADLDGDGDLDLVGRSTDVPIWSLLNDDNGVEIFGPMNFALLESETGCGVTVADFDGDGKHDLLQARSQNSVFRGYGGASYLAQENMPYFTGPLVKVVDIDGDGDRDFISEKIWFRD